ncbi:sec-independent protein translocase protein TatA [bacterium BMS3Abin07]|nr:sec-independent protein translocase protein TatA [bacterium BMS3Abin07]GBE32373.1 sec-independent protein translocase protein TatA [bacterium BMS3Bbin05]HDL19843.1 twin-arginine translocase TatA/TatE family subunit [Nitrospirota bacterium]HDO23414.1 twin-arginine translocase TatA/TatE family subunit [Nitrospirota bacterium]HDZ87814.1 twin-arginine translocase TatA/TatE family subunit [Nitrospirota bacterium]
MFGLGTQELLLILLMGGFLFGAKKLPELGKGLGQAIRGFKKSMTDPDEKELSRQKDDGETLNEKKEIGEARP